jgi:hypothetical protein
MKCREYAYFRMEKAMTGPGDKTKAEEAALWRRFRILEGESPLQDKDLPGEALALAAYAEGRLGEAAAERVEAWLAANPEAISDLVAARIPTQPAEPAAAALARAMALVAAPAESDAWVVPFRQKAAPAPGWRLFAARAAVAASLVVTGLAGFAMGSNVYTTVAGSSANSGGELFDQPLGVFSIEDSQI